MNLRKLEQLVREHNQIPFPEHPNNDELSTWIIELCESDGYYLGIAYSALKSGKCENLNPDYFFQMEKKLKSIKVDSEGDELILDSCYIHMESILNIINELKSCETI